MDKERSCDVLALQATPFTLVEKTSQVSNYYYKPASSNYWQVCFWSLTCEIHGLGFAGGFPSCPAQCRRVVLLLAHTHQISRKDVRL